MNPETLRRAAKAIDEYEDCARLYDRETEELYDLYELADAWEKSDAELRTLVREAMTPLRAMYLKTRSDELASWLRRARTVSR